MVQSEESSMEAWGHSSKLRLVMAKGWRGVRGLLLGNCCCWEWCKISWAGVSPPFSLAPAADDDAAAGGFLHSEECFSGLPSSMARGKASGMSYGCS